MIAYGGRDSTLSKVDVSANGLARRVFDSNEQSGFVQNPGGGTNRTFLNGGSGGLTVAGGASFYSSGTLGAYSHGLTPYVPTCIIICTKDVFVGWRVNGWDSAEFDATVFSPGGGTLSAGTYYFDFLAFRRD